MTWIKTVKYRDSTGKLRKLYDRVKGPDDNVDNIMMIHSFRPHTLEGHMVMYKNVLHHSSNSLEKWFLELIGIWVSELNRCDYCVKHHFTGLKRLLQDGSRAIKLMNYLSEKNINCMPLQNSEKLALEYAQLLTESPAKVTQEIVNSLYEVGFSDGEILEINQVVAYFNYANRTVLGLGCNTKGDILGLSPGNVNDPDDWSHN